MTESRLGQIHQISYEKAVKRCLKKHPSLFSKLLVHGSKLGGFGPPCKDCRTKAYMSITVRDLNKGPKMK